MNKLFYPRLAAVNIRKNAQTYIPYLLTCICTVMMFYIMRFIALNKGLDAIPGSDSMKTILYLGSIIIGIFSVIFLFYTNSFLVKRRKREFGLYNILGMEKKHIACVILMETIFVAAISLVIGLLLGILLSKLMLLVLVKLVSFSVPFGFTISLQAIVNTAVLFCGIFFLTLLNNLRQIHLAKPIELLQSSQTGEREPKTKWPIAIIGVICLAIGYFIALTTESPLAALLLFFLAVLLVIIGTYCLFTAGSIVVLKTLRKNKKYYYSPKHFTGVSGMIYRMKQNAAGLANICILSTMVLVVLSTTVSLYVGIDDALRTRFPRDIVLQQNEVTEAQVGTIDKVVADALAKHQVSAEDTVNYRSLDLMLSQAGDTFSTESTDYYGADTAIVTLIPLSDYNRTENANVTLGQDEALLYCPRGELKGDTVTFGKDATFQIQKQLSSMTTVDDWSSYMMNSYYFIVPDMAVTQIAKAIPQMQGHPTSLKYFYGFNLQTDTKTQVAIAQELKGAATSVESLEANRDEFHAIYGGLFFLGLFLGLLFIMATVLIIYYKQVSEGYDDKERFAILQKVGMSHSEVKSAIHSQVLTVFFLPLITAVIHIAFAFKIITKLLAMLNLSNVALFAGCTGVTILIFALLYAVVYARTARTYYNIVS